MSTSFTYPDSIVDAPKLQVNILNKSKQLQSFSHPRVSISRKWEIRNFVSCQVHHSFNQKDIFQFNIHYVSFARTYSNCKSWDNMGIRFYNEFHTFHRHAGIVSQCLAIVQAEAKYMYYSAFTIFNFNFQVCVYCCSELLSQLNG